VIKPLHGYNFGTVIPFLLLHAGCVAVFLVPFRWSLVWLMVAIYAVRMFGITADTTAISATAPTSWGVAGSLQWHFWQRPRGRKACCGGRHIIAFIIATQTMIPIFIPR